MRIWSLHPSLLDTKGLIACWRETLLAKAVLEGKTKGYTNHSQLVRFKKCKDPVGAINNYLYSLYLESHRRQFNFDFSKIGTTTNEKIPVTSGQLEYEYKHLLNKLKLRSVDVFDKVKNITPFQHEIFNVVEGDVESWEKI